MQKKPNLSFPIDAALDKRIQREAARTGLSRADIVRLAVRAALGMACPKAKVTR